MVFMKSIRLQMHLFVKSGSMCTIHREYMHEKRILQIIEPIYMDG